jgi:hypothetical protein
MEMSAIDTKFIKMIFSNFIDCQKDLIQFVDKENWHGLLFR